MYIWKQRAFDFDAHDNFETLLKVRNEKHTCLLC